MQELMPKGVAATVPPLYATEDEADPVARVKLFSCVSGWTWYVTEYDPATGEAFGLVEGFADEWGYFSICFRDGGPEPLALLQRRGARRAVRARARQQGQALETGGRGRGPRPHRMEGRRRSTRGKRAREVRRLRARVASLVRSALEGGSSCGSSDDLGEALGVLDVVFEFGLQGFVYDSEEGVVLRLDGHRRMGAAVTATGCRAFRRGAPGPQGALRPLGLRSGTAARRFCLRSRCARSKRSLGVALPTVLRSRRRRPANGCILWLPGVSTISPYRAPTALAAGFQTLSQGRLRKPSAHHPDGMARYALRRTNRRSSGLPAAMILPCAQAQGEGEPLATARSPDDGPLTTVRSHQKSPTADYLACMQCCGFTRIVDSPMNVGFACGPVRDSRMDASPRQRRSAHSGRRY